jgi:hypothetical protein
MVFLIFAFRIDDGVVIAEIISSRLVLKRELDINPDDLVEFSKYAAGRMLREEAQLSWDERSEKVFLWREISSRASQGEMRSDFEDFCDSCDWWEARIAEQRVPRTVFPDIMIHP